MAEEISDDSFKSEVMRLLNTVIVKLGDHDQRFESIDERFENLEKDVSEIKLNVKEISEIKSDVKILKDNLPMSSEWFWKTINVLRNLRKT